MIKNDERVASLVRSPSSVKNSTKITRSVSRSDLEALNRRIEKSIEKARKKK